MPMIELEQSRLSGHPRKLLAVLLDWAGTTVDFSSRAPVQAMVAAFEQAGVRVTDSDVRRFMGKAKRDHLANVFALPQNAEHWIARHGRTADDEDIDRVYESFLLRQSECLVRYSEVIPGCLDAVHWCRQQGLRVGAPTGYTRQLLDTVAVTAESEGYAPDVTICADDVRPGRPEPWLNFEAAKRLGVYPMSAMLIVDDTVAGVTAGRNAGAWTAGVVLSGNEVGLSREALEALPLGERTERIESARRRLTDAGAHVLIDTIAELPLIVERINQQLADGKLP